MRYWHESISTALIERTDMGAIIAATSSGMVSKAVDVARSQGVGIDFLLQRWSDRLHRRHSSAQSEARAAGPRARTGYPVTLYVAPDRDVELQGHYAGIFTRFVAFVIDLLAIVFVYVVFVRAAEFLVTTLSGKPWQISDLPVASWLVLILWAIFYCVYPVAAGGRTIGYGGDGLARCSPGWLCGWRAGSLRARSLPCP